MPRSPFTLGNPQQRECGSGGKKDVVGGIQHGTGNGLESYKKGFFFCVSLGSGSKFQGLDFGMRLPLESRNSALVTRKNNVCLYCKCERMKRENVSVNEEEGSKRLFLVRFFFLFSLEHISLFVFQLELLYFQLIRWSGINWNLSSHPLTCAGLRGQMP